jgi:hypothetical protein
LEFAPSKKAELAPSKKAVRIKNIGPNLKVEDNKIKIIPL